MGKKGKSLPAKSKMSINHIATPNPPWRGEKRDPPLPPTDMFNFHQDFPDSWLIQFPNR